MDVTIRCTVRDEDKVLHQILISNQDIEELVVKKAKEKGIQGYEGIVWRHLDETIVSISAE